MSILDTCEKVAVFQSGKDEWEKLERWMQENLAETPDGERMIPFLMRKFESMRSEIDILRRANNALDPRLHGWEDPHAIG